MLVAVSNLGHNPAQVEIRLNREALRLPGTLQAVDALTGKLVAIAGATVTLPLEPVEWRLLWVKP